MQLAYVCIVIICTHTKQMQAARILYDIERLNYRQLEVELRAHVCNLCTFSTCALCMCVALFTIISAAHILQLSIYVRDYIDLLQCYTVIIVVYFIRCCWSSVG